MKKTSHLKTFAFLVCLPLLTLSSCNKGAEEYDGHKSGQVNFDVSIGAVTRSTIGWDDFKCTFDAGDAIGIFAVPSGTELASSGNYANNIKLVKQADGSWNYAAKDQTIFFPAGDIALDIYAYYPYSESLNDPRAFLFDAGTDQSSGAQRSELLWTSKSNIHQTDNQIALSFAHMLAMIQIEVSPAADSSIAMQDITYIDIKLNGLKSAVTFNMGDGSANLTGDAGRIKMEQRAGSYLFRALVPVQEVIAGSILFSCTVGQAGKSTSGGTDYTQFNYEASPDTALSGGVVRLYNVKLP